MNTKNRTYMNNSEFKERQNSFQFFCAQAFEFLVQFKTECMAGWKKLFKPVHKVINLTMELPFNLFVVYSYEERKQA